MGGTTDRHGTVLVVDDEPPLADLYTDCLADTHDVVTTYGGEEAIEALSSAIDVVLADRRMPVVSGNEVLAAVEARDLEARVALVTAVDPDFDIVDMGVDDYLIKPVTCEDLREAVDRLLALEEFDERARELSGKRITRNVLAIEKSAEELRESAEFARLAAKIRDLERELDDIESEIATLQAGDGTATLERYR